MRQSLNTHEMQSRSMTRSSYMLIVVTPLPFDYTVVTYSTDFFRLCTNNESNLKLNPPHLYVPRDDVWLLCVTRRSSIIFILHVRSWTIIELKGIA